MNNYIYIVLITLEIYILLAFSLNLKTGASGLLSLSQAAIYGSAAYITAILTTRYAINFFLALFLGCFINVMIFTPLFVYLSQQLKSFYFTLSTLAIQIIFFGIVYNWQSVTGGTSGILVIKPKILETTFDTSQLFLIISSVFTISSIILLWRFYKTPLFKMIEATRDDEQWLCVLGKRPTYFKFISITGTVILASVAGSLYASYIGYIHPDSFNLDESIIILSIILIGGTGNLKGPIIGALTYVLLPEILRFVNIPDNYAANTKMIIYALTLILIVRFRPNGLFGKREISG